MFERRPAAAILAALCGAALLAAGCDNAPGGTPAPLPDTASDTGTLSDGANLDTASDAATDIGATDSSSGDADLPAAWFACSGDSDCSPVEIGCCDHCNGGEAIAAATAHASEVKAALGAKNCNRVACTEKGCSPVVTVCQAGKCAVGSQACNLKGEASCSLDPACMPIYGWPKAALCAGKNPPKEFLGCRPFGGCDDAVGCATSPSGAQFQVSQLCAPVGWSVAAPACCTATCTPAQPARLCVRGKPTATGEALAAGETMQLQVTPKGCYSSSCTKVVTATCAASLTAGTWSVAATFCLQDTSGAGRGCTADCGGGGLASCSGGAWTAGTHKLVLGGESVTVTVPSELPFGGVCAGNPF
ncbi:MAG: hypothetical protein HY902_18535 [Deltaproteobacteria bacterium]|nr:hypothetical protein [Deltaproteobacteria bacterium]